MEVSSIRPGTRADLPRLVALEAAAFPGDRLSTRSFRALIARPTSSVLVAVAGEELLGYSLVLFRTTSPIARLYSIAIAPAARGQGLAKRLMDAAESDAIERGAKAMRLEVRADNTAAIRLYEGLGYRPIGRHVAYYEDQTDALRFEKVLVRPAVAPSRFDATTVPYWPQTTEFTCGAATLMMALAATGRVEAMSEELELAIWREATCIYLISAPGGCDPFGLAVAARQRGFRVALHVSEPGPYFVDVTRGAAPKQIMTTQQAEYVRQAEALHIPVASALDVGELVAALDRGAFVINLISPYRLGHGVVPHWVLAFARSGDEVRIHDPYLPPATIPRTDGIPINLRELERMSVWGRSRLRAAIVLEEPHPQ